MPTAPARGRGAGPARPPAGHRARAPGRRLGPLGARRGPLRPDARRLLLPPVVPLRGRGHRERPRRRAGAAGLQPLRRAAARRGDDRQGDQGGAPAPPRRPRPRRALLQGLPGLPHAAAEDRRRGRPPGQRPPPALRRAAARARLPRGRARAPRSSTRTATACAASAAAASSRPRCAPARRSSRSPSSAPRRPAPIFAQLGLLQKLTGLLYFPLTPTFPHFGLARRCSCTCPAKFTIRFLPPVRTDDMGDEPWEDKGLVQTVAHDIRATIQDELFDMVGKRESVWFGDMTSKRDPHHRPVDLLGRPPRPGARAGPGRRDGHRRRPAPAEGRARAHGVRPGRGLPLADPPHRRGRRDRHGRRHAPGRRLASSRARSSPTRTTSSAR